MNGVIAIVAVTLTTAAGLLTGTLATSPPLT